MATKWNLVTCLTGTSYEKLQVYHRWMAWIMCRCSTRFDMLTADILALIHTFPFIILDIKRGEMQAKMREHWYTFSGVICLVPMTLLMALSFACIRNRAYEIFKG